MSVEPLENPKKDLAADGQTNGAVTTSVTAHSHGHMLASNMAQESGHLPLHSETPDKNANGIKAAFVNIVSPINDPLWYQGANAYATRKTVITSLINIALLTSTAGQLKSLMRINPAYPFYNSLMGMLIVCILAEITIGILLFVVGRLNLNRIEQRSRAELLQNVIMGIVVLILILHIMNTAFGIEDLTYLAPTSGAVTTSVHPSSTTLTVATTSPAPSGSPVNSPLVYVYANTAANRTGT